MITPELDPFSHVTHISTLPGSGKTYTFLTHAVEHLMQESKPDQYLVYAAPTVYLLIQVLRDLEKMLPKGLSPDKVVCFLSAQTDLVRTSLPTDIKRLGAKFTNMGLIKKPPGVVAGITRYVNDEEFRFKQVILVTHETFANFHVFPRADKCVLYFDEARSCTTQAPGRAKIPLSNFVDLLKVLKPKPLYNPEGEPLFGVLRPFPSIKKPDKPMTRMEFIKFLKELLPSELYTHNARHLQKIYDHAFNPRLSSFVHLNGLDLKKLDDVKLKESLAKHPRTVMVINLRAPGLMFKGFKKVLLLSAFFETSEMRFLLQKALRKELLKTFPDKVVDEYVNTWIERSREPLPESVVSNIKKLTEHRYTKLVIAPLLLSAKEHEKADGDIITANGLAHDVVMNRDDMNALLECSIEVNRGTRALLNFIRTNDIPKEYAPAIARLQERVGSAKLHTYPLYDLVVMASKAALSWKYNRPNPLIVTNSMLNHCPLDGDNLRYLLPEEEKDTVFLKTKTHGLNMYQDSNVVAFLAALSPTPLMYKFYKNYIPEYDVHLDTTIEVAVQAVCRSSIRSLSPNNLDTPVLCLVINMDVAEKLKEMLFNKPTISTSVMNHFKQKMIYKRQPVYVSPKKPILTPEQVTESRRIRNLLNWYEKKYEDCSYPPKVKAKVNELEKRRLELKAYGLPSNDARKDRYD